MRVIVFALHGCPAGWLGAYGNDWVGTPNLDRLASEAVTFDRHVSDCPEPEAARRAWRARMQDPTPRPPPPGGEGVNARDASRETGALSSSEGSCPPSPP